MIEGIAEIIGLLTDIFGGVDDVKDIVESDDFDIEGKVFTTQEVERPFMTTDFNDYTVTEGLLLLIVLFAFMSALYHIVRRFV